MARFFQITSLSLLPLFLTACALGEEYKLPDFGLPDAFIIGEEVAPEPAPEPVIAIKWWEKFGDPVLNALAAQALASGLDAREAQARLREAQAQERAAIASLLPAVDLTASAERARSSANGRRSTVQQSGGSGGINNLYQAGASAFWDIDIFGGRRALEAADAAMEAVQASRDDALLALASEVARNYVELRLYQAQGALARDNADTQSETARITSARYREGVEGSLQVSRAQAQLSSTQAQVPLYARLSGASQYRLEFLLSQNPGSLEETLKESKGIPFADAEIVLDAPVNVIARRPDVRAAERNLASFTALKGVALADYFPRLSISGLLGFESATTNNLLLSGSRVWSAGGSVILPLIDFGRIRANVDVADARAEQAVIQYERAVRSAVQEVESAALAYTQEVLRRSELLDAVGANEKAVSIARLQYKEGILSQLDVLEAQRTLYEAEVALAQSTADASYNFIALYRALGILPPL